MLAMIRQVRSHLGQSLGAGLSEKYNERLNLKSSWRDWMESNRRGGMALEKKIKLSMLSKSNVLEA
jgi:hypothetical protein